MLFGSNYGVMELGNNGVVHLNSVEVDKLKWNNVIDAMFHFGISTTPKLHYFITPKFYFLAIG